jgi:ATP-dependent protease ClpP protease subunit
MTDIELTGEIGWEVTADSFRRALASASGDIRVRIHSPGGSVSDGIDIANAIRGHRRAGNAVTAYVSGICMSMATYIASVCDAVEVEDNAVYMIHNPWMFALGDYRDMAKANEILSGLSRVLAGAYAERTERTINAVRSEMDAETWLFGAEIVDAGYADSVVPAGEGEEDRADAVAVARTRWQSLQIKMKEREAQPEFDRIAAMMPHQPEDAVMADETPAAGTPEPQVPETNSVDAVAAERARVSAIMDRCNAVGMPELMKAALDDGLTMDQLNARIVDAYTARGGTELRSAVPSGPSPVDTAAIERRIFNQVAVGGIR